MVKLSQQLFYSQVFSPFFRKYVKLVGKGVEKYRQ
jgi:hypothetical protein